MAGDSRHTGSEDKNYDLISSVYHALQGAQTVGMYIEDAERDGDRDLADFFRDVQSEYRDLAERGKKLLGERFGTMTP